MALDTMITITLDQKPARFALLAATNPRHPKSRTISIRKRTQYVKIALLARLQLLAPNLQHSAQVDVVMDWSVKPMESNGKGERQHTGVRLFLYLPSCT